MSVMIVLTQMIKLFLIMCLGFGLYKWNIFDQHTKQHLTKLLLYVTTPALIIHSFVENTGNDDKSILGELFITATIFYLALSLVAIILNKVLRIKKPSQGVYLFMTVFGNVGFMGFPVVDALLGIEGVFYAAIFNCVFNISVFTIGIFLITFDSRGSNSSIKDFFNLKTLLNPGILCCFVAAFLFLLDVPVPAVFLDVLDSVGGLTSPIAMMLVGASLAVMDIKELFGDYKIYVYTLLRQIVLPIGAWFLIRPMIPN